MTKILHSSKLQESFERVAAQHGWSVEDMLHICLNFIAEEEHEAQFRNHLHWYSEVARTHADGYKDVLI